MLAGGLAVAGFAPLAWLPAAPLSLLLLLALCQRSASPGAAAWLGWCWGLGCFLGGVSWVYVSMHDIGGMPALLAATATLLFCAYLALYPALAVWLARRLASGHAGADALACAGAWTLGEWLRGTLLTGFPWLALGYSQAPPSPLAGFAPLLGVYGLSFLVALAAASLLRLKTRGALAVAVLLAAGSALTRVAWTDAVGAPLDVSLLQGNIEQSLKWEPQRQAASLATYARLARAHPAQLTVLPETALPLFLDQAPPAYLAELTTHGEVLTGVVQRDSDGRYFNAGVLLHAGTAGASYSKSHLVPFGEFVPPGFSWFLGLMRIPMSDFSAGPARQAPLAVAGQSIAPNICYEDLFGEEIIHALPQATLLVNLSNTAWFGASLAQAQHLQIAQLRALEAGRTMLRATNTGMTAVVGPDGVVRVALPAFVADALSARVQGYAGATPYVRLGNSPILLLALAALLPAAWRRRRGRVESR